MHIDKNILIHWFLEHYPNLVKDMKKSDHGVTNEEHYKPMPYHMEGSVWTHTLMVMTYIETYFSFVEMDEYVSQKNYICLLTSSLLHDIGKPSSRKILYREDRGNYYSFVGHEGISTILSIDILHKLKESFPKIYTKDILDKILYLISLHGSAIQEKDSELLFLRKTFSLADKNGALRNPNMEKNTQYSNRKFHTLTKKEENKELIILTGLPASGKSTYFENHLKDKGFFKICRDDIMVEWFNLKQKTNDIFNKEKDNKNYTYSFIYEHIHTNKEVLKDFNSYYLSYIQKISKTQNKVVIDMTMLSLKSRRNMLNIFHKFTAKSIVLLPSYEDVLFRNLLRNYPKDFHSLSKDLKIILQKKTNLSSTLDLNNYLEQNCSNEGKYIPLKTYKDFCQSFVLPIKEEGFTEVILVTPY